MFTSWQMLNSFIFTHVIFPCVFLFCTCILYKIKNYVLSLPFQCLFCLPLLKVGIWFFQHFGVYVYNPHRGRPGNWEQSGFCLWQIKWQGDTQQLHFCLWGAAAHSNRSLSLWFWFFKLEIWGHRITRMLGFPTLQGFGHLVLHHLDN